MKIKELYRQLIMYGCVNIDESIIFYNYINGCIVKLDTKTGLSHILWMDKTDNFIKWNMYGGAERSGNEIVFAPRCAENILVFNQKDNQATFIPYETKSLFNGNRLNQFVNVHLHGDYYYFFPGRNDEIIKMHKDTHALNYISGWSAEIGELPVPGSVKFSNARRIDEEICMLPCFQKGKVLEFHMGSDTWKVHDICDEALSDIVFDGSEYWICQRNTCGIVRWDQINGNKVVIKANSNTVLKESGFIYIVDAGESLILVPFKERGLLRLYKNNREFEVIPVWDGIDIFDNMKQINKVETNAFSCKRLCANKNLIYDAFRGQLIILDAITGSYRFVPMLLSEEDALSIQKKHFEIMMPGIVTENESMNLYDYFSYVSSL